MSVQLPPYRPLRRRNGLKVMLAAIHALLMRELQTRFGGYRLGYLWAPLEVFLQVSVYLVIFGALMHRILPGMEYSIFLLSGIIPYTMFNRIVTRSMGAVEANRGLLMYRSVKHIDVIMARGFLELIIYFFSFWLLLSGIIFFQDFYNDELDGVPTGIRTWVARLGGGCSIRLSYGDRSEVK